MGNDAMNSSRSRLTDGGEEGPCGWLKDRYGLSWQVVPDGFAELMPTAAELNVIDIQMSMTFD